ncbi:MAG: metal ABC transporter permease, partial [Acidimicrobiia bacterium]
VETALFATGVLVISSTDRIGVDLTHFLFGQIVTVGRSDIVVNVALAIGALTIVGARFGDLRATAFDEEHAAQVGIHVDRLRLTLLGLISITVVISLDTVGLLMSVAMLVTPAAAARLITTRVETMTAVAVGIGTSSALGGLTLSYHLGTPPGPTIALTTVAWFGTVWAHTARKARLAPSRHQRP